MNDRKTNKIHCVPKHQADAFLPKSNLVHFIGHLHGGNNLDYFPENQLAKLKKIVSLLEIKGPLLLDPRLLFYCVTDQDTVYIR